MCKVVFYKCLKCGNLVAAIYESGVPMICCGEPMSLLKANVVEASQEKHIPVVTRDGATLRVTVGSVEHPMLPEHFIQWIFLETKNGWQRKCLSAGDKPEAVFALTEDTPVSVYEYCNIHGLWKVDL